VDVGWVLLSSSGYKPVRTTLGVAFRAVVGLTDEVEMEVALEAREEAGKA
jgi:hypothetical protein